MARKPPFLGAFAAFLLSATISAQDVRLELESRAPVLAGRSFGPAGGYEKLRGRLHFTVDPANPANARIADLGLAPRDARGRVACAADFMVLQPADPERRRGTALLEVSNRGGKAALAYFNRAASAADPRQEEHFGDGLLMRLGLTVIWVGWQFDVPAAAGRLRLEAPVARQPDGAPLTGLARCDWTVDRGTPRLELGHRGHRPYPVADPADEANRLSWRAGREAPRQEVPRKDWSFSADGTAIEAAVDFPAGRIYELVYRARDPVVAGLGLAVIRDTAAWSKNGADCPFPAQRVIAVGISQTGRFLRHFLYQGFNTDEAGRMALDGMLVLTAGAGRGSFNHRFAQPSRDAHRYSAFFYPTDLFPFSGALQQDPVTGAEDGLFAHLLDPEHLPKIFFVNTGYEYWGRAAALIHTTPDGKRDLPPGPRERIYHLASAQHYQGRHPPRENDRVPGARAWQGNPLEIKSFYRALLVALLDWVEGVAAPPPSAFPRIADGSLVPFGDYALPAIPGLQAPAAPHTAYRADYGPRWAAEGVVTLQPPVLGRAFPALVPQVDRAGNEYSGLRQPEVAAPIATWLPWSLRTGAAGSPEEQADFVGTFAPFPRETQARGGDPRTMLGEAWPDRTLWLQAVRADAEKHVRARTLLAEDLDYLVDRAGATWDFVEANP